MQIRKSLILLLVAYGLTLLHSAIPHQHSSIRTSDPKFEVRTVGDFSLFGRLQAAFATDLGCGHLESFAKSDGNADIAPIVTDVPVLFLASHFITEEPLINVREASGAFIGKLHTRLVLLSALQFRAPPVLI